jgi:hypothetical protein
MANQKLFEVTSGDGTSIYIEYNDVNLKVGNIFFTVPAGKSAHVLLWDDGVLIYDQIYGEGFHSENVPGNYRLQEYTTSWGETRLTLPPIDWSFSEIRS